MAIKPVEEIPVNKPKYNQDRALAVRDLQHMAAQGIRRAEVIPENAERWYKNPGGYSEKLNWAARHVRFHDFPGARFKVSYKRDAEHVPHWYVELTFDGEVPEA